MTKIRHTARLEKGKKFFNLSTFLFGIRVVKHRQEISQKKNEQGREVHIRCQCQALVEKVKNKSDRIVL